MTTDAIDNVVPFAQPQPKEVPPELQFIEVRLNEADCSLVVSVCDEAGNIFPLTYKLSSVPSDFDLDRLRDAWPRWRGTSTAAS
jgi:hypothetical protein